MEYNPPRKKSQITSISNATRKTIFTNPCPAFISVPLCIPPHLSLFSVFFNTVIKYLISVYESNDGREQREKKALGLDSHQDVLTCSQPRICSATRALHWKDPVETVFLRLGCIWIFPDYYIY